MLTKKWKNLVFDHSNNTCTMFLIALFIKSLPVEQNLKIWLHFVLVSMPLSTNASQQQQQVRCTYSVLMFKDSKKYVKWSSVCIKVTAKGLQSYVKWAPSFTFLYSFMCFKAFDYKCRTVTLQESHLLNIYFL